MDIHQLELFLAVMDSPSMTRAAEKIHLSPGAVSLQLHNLADELHTELFVRRGKRLIPTPAALRLAERAKEVVKMMGHIQQEFENDLAKDVRPFHFATGVTTLIYQLGNGKGEHLSPDRFQIPAGYGPSSSRLPWHAQRGAMPREWESTVFHAARKVPCEVRQQDYGAGD